MGQGRCFSHGEAKRFYDGLGAALDTQAFYEAPVSRILLEHLDLKTSRAVVEFGCGTGRLAEEMLKDHLPPDAGYLGLDISGTMVALTGKRLARYGNRVCVSQSEGTPRIGAADNAFDRFICTYVLDLLSDDEIRAVLEEAHRILEPGGLLGLISLTNGTTAMSAAVSSVWGLLHRISPWIVGVCRPVRLAAAISPTEWKIGYTNVVTPYGIPSELVVATCISKV